TLRIVRYAQAGALTQAPVTPALLAIGVHAACIAAGWLSFRCHASSLVDMGPPTGAHGLAVADSRRESVERTDAPHPRPTPQVPTVNGANRCQSSRSISHAARYVPSLRRVRCVICA